MIIGNVAIHTPSVDDMQDIICGPTFDDLPNDHDERVAALREAEERFRLFYKMIENVLANKEQEEILRQGG